MKMHLYHLLTWAILCTMTLGCDRCSDEEPAPEKVCKLLYRSDYSTTYEYDDKYRLIQLTGNGGSTKYTYDKNGFLTEKTYSDGSIDKYRYTNGLLTKITYPQGRYDRETSYEYDSQKRLTKSIHSYRDGTITRNYNNGKEISFIRNESGTITQPFQYENGQVIRITQNDRSYAIYDYDAKGRNIRYTKFDNTGKTISYGEYTFQDGISFENAAPEMFFKGFPDEIKNIRPDGLQKTAIYYEMRNNTLIKSAETISTNILNSKGYVTSQTNTQSYRNSAGTWISNNPYKITYSYINCDE